MGDLDTLRTIGQQGAGVVRPAFSDADVMARQWLLQRMIEAGLETHVDHAGNVFGIPACDEPSLLIGSHTDTQPDGGWLDGAYGVIVGLEIARASLECGGPPIACVSFQDEESRFSMLTGSRIWAGELSLADADKSTDTVGQTFANARANRGSLPAASEVPCEKFRAFLEIHIEQGPILHRSSERIGVVENFVGVHGMMVRLVGEQNHAGTTPMSSRRDALQGFVQVVRELNTRLPAVVTPTSVWTIGHVSVYPNAMSIVPGQIDFHVQWRDPEETRLQRMGQVVAQAIRKVAERLELDWQALETSAIAPTPSDARLTEVLAKAANARVPGRWRRMSSGALHDATSLSGRMPIGMLFVPSIDGISHNSRENTNREDLILGAEILAMAASRI